MTFPSTFPCLCYVYRYKCEFTECKDRDLSVSVAIICCGILGAAVRGKRLNPKESWPAQAPTTRPMK